MQDENAAQRLYRLMRSRNTRLCVGLDPDLTKFSKEILSASTTPDQKIYDFLTGVVDVTAGYVCAYKAQKAFFDLVPGGQEVLMEVIAYAHTHYPEIPVIVDCKVGDIENSMAAYAATIFSKLGADGIVVNPYMGDDVLEPLKEYADKAVVVLAKTSNPGGSIVQDVVLQSGLPFWQHVLELIVHRWNTNGNLIPVISSTADIRLDEVRLQIPDMMPILFAGVGAQGGSLSGVKQLLNSEQSGVFVNSSRGIIFSQPSQPDVDWKIGVKEAAIRLMLELNQTGE